MNLIDFQAWLGAHGHPVDVDGVGGPQTRAAILSVFTNPCADAVTDDQIQVLADRLGCSPKQLRAVGQVESAGGGFDRDGHPKILFERHLFHRFTNGAYDGTIYSDPVGGGYNLASWPKLMQAACKDVQAAFAATSWGKFQVLGAHADGSYHGFLNLGYPSPLEMAYTAVTSEGAHYEMLARYIEKAGLQHALAKISTNPEDNRALAKGYNGPGYERFDYHQKLATAMQ